MPSRNIAVQKTVYDLLSREKRAGESFTALFRRLLDQRGGIDEIVGSWGHPGRGEGAILKDIRSGGRRK